MTTLDARRSVMSAGPLERPWHLRELTPCDGATLDQVLAGMSQRSRRRRYHSAVESFPPGMRQQLTAVDGQRHFAVAA